MTWTRVGCVTAESNSIAEFDILMDSGSINPGIVAVPNTGAYSVRCGVAFQAHRASGLLIPTSPTVRASWWFSNAGVYGAPAIPRLATFKTAAGTNALIITVSQTTVTLTCGALVGTCTLAESGLSSTNVWQHIAITYYKHPSAGYVTLYINGSPVITVTGAVALDVAGVFSGNGTSGTHSWGNYAQYDDFYVDVSDVFEVDECPDARRFIPSALVATLSSDFTLVGAANAHTALATHDSDTSYITAIVAGKRFVGTLADVTIPPEYSPMSVHVLDFAKRGDADSGVLISLIDGAANEDQSDYMKPGTSYTRQWSSYPLAPDAGEWTPEKVNDLSLAIESDGTFL